MKITKTPNLSYDECDIIESEVEYLKTLKENKKLSDDELTNLAYDDSFLFDDRWNDFKEDLTEVLKEIDKKGNSVFNVKGVCMGWRNLEGHKILKAENGEELLKGILPDTNQFSLYVWKEKTQIKIKCSHHDSPMGEYYFIKPLSKIEFKQYQNGVLE